jgi:glyoxylase I family protein
VLRVKDMDRMLDFYTRVVGCELAHRQDDLGLVHLRAGESLIDLVDVAGELGMKGGDAPTGMSNNMDHLCLRVANFDSEAIRSELAGHGVEAGEIAERYGASGKAVSIYLRDPEGNGLEMRG